MEIIFLFSLAISFVITLMIIPPWIKKSKSRGFLWEDMNKYKHPKNVASSGGVVVMISFVLGVLYYIAVKTFVIKSYNSEVIEIFALLNVILIFTIIGFIDDLWDWRSGGLSKRWRLILAAVASIPLIAINVGTSSMSIPLLGTVDFGIIYPLLLVPLGIVGAATTYNFLAGFNGLEASQGIIILSFLSFVAYKTGSSWLAIVGMTMDFSLIAFYFFNKCPAKIFPGDSMTWCIGALIAIMAILGNFEKIAVFVFIPYIIETVLKTSGKLEKHSFGEPNKDGSLDMPYKKIYGLTHAGIYILKKIKPNKKAYENEVVYLINGFQILIILIAYFLFL